MEITNPDSIFVDTSGLFAVLDADDRFHPSAREGWTQWIEQETLLLTSNYVMVEATALIQSRLGMEAVKVLYEAILPLLRVEWVTRVMHQCGINAFLAADRRRLSFVDCISFEMMRDLGLCNVFTFDHHFAERDSTCLP